MSNRIFLEDVGTPYGTTALGHARVWEVRHLKNDPTIPSPIYVIESETGQEFLLGRHICGRPKFNMIRYLAKSFVDLFFEQLKGKQLSQYLILRGAYPFDLQNPMGNAPPYDVHLLPTGFIKLQRVLNQAETDWEIHAHSLIGDYQGDTWLVPDTAIASGSTIAFFLRNGFVVHRPKRVYVITACGSLEGIQRIYRECHKAHVELIPVFHQCIFQVSKEGNLPGLPLTDLSVASPGSITTRDLYAKALDRYQETRMCCVGDIGESLEDPVQYSIHTLWEMQTLGMDPKREAWSIWTVDVLKDDFHKKVAAFKPDLAAYFKEIWGEEKR